MRFFILSIVFCGTLHAQSILDTDLRVPVKDSTLGANIAHLNQALTWQIFCPGQFRELTVEPLQEAKGTLGSVLEHLLTPHGLMALVHRERLVVIVPQGELSTSYSAAFYQALEEGMAYSPNGIESEVVIGAIDDIKPGKEIRLRGRVTDAENEEPIIGATLLLEEEGEGEVTNELGDYELVLSAGSHTLLVQYIGYQTERVPLQVISSDTLEIALRRSSVLLEEIVVQAKARNENVQSTLAGVTRISTKEIQKLPSFLGEVDILKGLLLQPGVNTIGEGASGFNVRGGNVDQNLILMDEALVFNPNHALGFFSAFNSDIVSEAVLFKGTMPARYGGRLASVLDVKIRDGSFDRWHVMGGLGLVSSRLTLDGPISRGKTSVLFSARSTYSDWLLQRTKVPEVKASSAFFYDANFRISHKFNEKNNLILSAYQTQDHFSFNNAFGFSYATSLAQAQFRKVLGSNTLSKTNMVWSRYISTQDDLAGVDQSEYKTGLEYVKLKETINYLGAQFQANLGGSAIFYKILGNQIMPASDQSTIVAQNLDDQKSIEWSLFADFDYQVSPRLSLIGGVRWTLFQFLGPQNTFLYEDPSRPTFEGLLEPITLQQQVIQTFQDLQPRLSFRYKLTANSSVKGGYGRTVQYINQIFNSETPTPTNFWQLSNQYIPAQKAHNFSLGYFQNFNDNIWITSLEGFYRNIDALYDYREFADLLVNRHLETELLTGVGRSYGVELSVKRQVGFIHGWVSYTYARSERQIEGINRGAWYPSNFDKTHDLTIVNSLQINKRNSISINFSYSTGRPITIPSNKHLVQDRVVVLSYSERNAFRIPDYHRLDLSYNLAQGLRKSKRFKTSWTFSIYNLYARKNPYSVFAEQAADGTTIIKRLAVLGSAFPSLTFNLELL